MEALRATLFRLTHHVRLIGVLLVACAVASAAHAQPLPPTNVQATNGTSCDRITITWDASVGATSYTVWRSTINNPGSAAQIGSTVALIFNDNTAVPLTTYWYWVRAVNSSNQSSGFSDPASGFRNQIPVAPSGVSATDDQFCDRVRITWNAVLSADSYDVLRNTTNTPGTAVSIGTTASTSLDDLNALPNTTYWYWVRARNACGVSVLSNSDSGRARGLPPQVTGVQASDGTVCDWVTVTWNTITGVTSYNIFRNTTSNFSTATQIGSTVAPPFDDLAAAPGVTYWYWVQAVDPCGVGPPSTANTGFRPSTPRPPSNVQASDGTSCASVTVTWDAAPSAIAYAVWRNTSNTPSTATRLIILSVTQYNDESALPGVQYWYWVESFTFCGNSDFSAPDTGHRASLPAAPQNVSATDGASCDGVEISWSAVTGATNYIVRRATSSDPSTGMTVGSTPGTTWHDDTASQGLTYWYWVTAQSACGQSPRGGPDTGHALHCPQGLYANFESPDYSGSAIGTPLTGQQTWINPIPAGADMHVYMQAGNALNIPANPVGGGQILAGRRAGPGLSARAARDFHITGPAQWTVAIDMLGMFDGTLPALEDLGNVGLSNHRNARGFRARLVWDDPNTAESYSIIYDVFDASGTEVAVSPGPEFEQLEAGTWYRLTTAIDYATNQITAVAITDLETFTHAIVSPPDWYMLGGSSPSGPRASTFFIATTGGSGKVSGEGNITAWDNAVAIPTEFEAGFEPTLYAGTPTGVTLTGQNFWVRDQPGDRDHRALTYTQNALGIVDNPVGGTQFAAGRSEANNNRARAAHVVDLGASDRWEFSFDVTPKYDAIFPVAPANIGFFAANRVAGEQGVRVDFWWQDPAEPGSWRILVRSFDENNAQRIVSPGPAWANLTANRWYRITIRKDFGQNLITSLTLRDLNTGAQNVIEPTGWYMFGGAAAGTPRGTAVRFAAIGDGGPSSTEGNVLAFDNVGVRPLAGCYPDCDPSTGVGVLDIFDFLCFQNRFVNMDPYACDCDETTGTGVCDIFDFLCFQNAFVGGCL